MIYNCNKTCTNSCCGADKVNYTPVENRLKTIALIGQPNTGKSTIFNRITGAKQHVGNWPGKTVEKKEGIIERHGDTFHIYDLPGTYSLTANSIEETIARDFIIKEKPDVVVIVVDAAQLERSLYMVAEVAELDVKMIVAFNKMDIAMAQGFEINLKNFEKASGVTTIPVTASKNEGINDLLAAVSNTFTQKPHMFRGTNLPFLKTERYSEIIRLIEKAALPLYPRQWLSLKFFEGDLEVKSLLQKNLDAETWDQLEKLSPASTEEQMVISRQRSDWIKHLLPILLKRTKTTYTRNRFDVAATHPVWGKIIALLVLFFGVISTYIIALPLMIPGFIMFFSADMIQNFLAGFSPVWFSTMIGDGLIGGLSIAFMILGCIGGVFIVLGFLENSGYLARLAYVFDPFMQRVGLHGKSIMPLIMGFMCNIIGVAGSRVIDTWRQRITTLVVVPIIPCKGLIIVIGFITAVFFGAKAPIIFLSLAVVTIIYFSLATFVLRKKIIPGESSGLIMEMPPYHMPSFHNLAVFAGVRMAIFYKRGFWFIVLISLLAWVFIYFPDGIVENSYLATFGRKLEFFGQVVGWDWRFCIIFLVACFSKEATLGTMAVIFSASTAANTDFIGIGMDHDLWAYIRSGAFHSFMATTGLSSASALALIFAMFFSLPCFGTLTAIWVETRSLVWTLGSLFSYVTMSIVMGGLAYMAGLLLF